MPNKTIIGFEVTEEYKERIIQAGNNYKIDGVSYPLKLSGFCRIATEKFLREVENKEVK